MITLKGECLVNDTTARANALMYDIVDVDAYQKAIDEVLEKIFSKLTFNRNYFRYETRIKDISSLLEKLKRKNCDLCDLLDIAGIRFVFGDFSLVSDNFSLVDLQRILNDSNNDPDAIKMYVEYIFSKEKYSVSNDLSFDFVKKLRCLFGEDVIVEKDYLNHPKSSGYQSYHVVVRASNGYCVEIQIRNLCQHIWSFLEHDAVYKGNSTDKKFYVNFAEEINDYAKKYSMK